MRFGWSWLFVPPSHFPFLILSPTLYRPRAKQANQPHDKTQEIEVEVSLIRSAKAIHRSALHTGTATLTPGCLGDRSSAVAMVTQRRYQFRMYASPPQATRHLIGYSVTKGLRFYEGLAQGPSRQLNCIRFKGGDSG